ALSAVASTTGRNASSASHFWSGLEDSMAKHLAIARSDARSGADRDRDRYSSTPWGIETRAFQIRGSRIQAAQNRLADADAGRRKWIMKISTFGAIVASAVVGLAGAVAFAEAGTTDAKACYRPHCGKSIKGHEGKCGGMQVSELSTQAMCESAG